MNKTNLFKRFTTSNKLNKVLNISDFIHQNPSNQLQNPHSSSFQNIEKQSFSNLKNKSFFLKTYGCQMNLNDSEIVKTILESQHMLSSSEEQADIVLINTCAIRENAEQKIWTFLSQLSAKKQESMKNDNKKKFIGILGCMAERLKEKIIDEQRSVDLIVGPDAYKDLPRLLDMIFSELNTDSNNYAINTQLSIDETYADIFPVKSNAVSAMISIMRGCSNMCSFCIVPFTRGIERSRPLDTILKEVDLLKNSGIKEITLLGQNVNSYLDSSIQTVFINHQNTQGFKENFKLRNKPGYRFADLLEKLAIHAPEIRFRFVSPHPKDFPDAVLDVIANFNNISKYIHMPAQSGSTSVLERMNRNYSKEAYINLIQKVREKIPQIAISTDLIVGFCDENEQEFEDTLKLAEEVKFDSVY